MVIPLVISRRRNAAELVTVEVSRADAQPCAMAVAGFTAA